jgi:hypothetical protein
MLDALAVDPLPDIDNVEVWMALEAERLVLPDRRCPVSDGNFDILVVTSAARRGLGSQKRRHVGFHSDWKDWPIGQADDGRECVTFHSGPEMARFLAA